MNIKPGVLIAIVIILAVAVVGIILIGSNKPKTSPATEIKPLEQSQIADITEEIKGISGKIVAVEKDTIVVEALIMMKDPSKPPIKHNIKVTADANTKITKTTFPSPEKIMGSTKPVEPKEETLTINQLKVGDTVDIRTSENVYENIKAGTPFVAKEIDAVVYE